MWMHVFLVRRVRKAGTCDYQERVKLYQEGIDLAVMQRRSEEQMIRSILVSSPPTVLVMSVAILIDKCSHPSRINEWKRKTRSFIALCQLLRLI